MLRKQRVPYVRGRGAPGAEINRRHPRRVQPRLPINARFAPIRRGDHAASFRIERVVERVLQISAGNGAVLKTGDVGAQKRLKQSRAADSALQKDQKSEALFVGNAAERIIRILLLCVVCVCGEG